MERGLPLEGRALGRRFVEARRRFALAGGRLRDGASRTLEALADRSFASLARLWLGLVLGFGVLFWLASALPGWGLRESGGAEVPFTAAGLVEAIYFSFVTALSIGYGDVTPGGMLRIPAIVEGAAALLLFGVLISKLVSRRQEELTAEIHALAFEDRLVRVRSNLHFALSELQELAAICATSPTPPLAVARRVESAVAVFAAELRAIHDLLYRPQQAPEEETLEGILAGLATALDSLAELLACAGAKGARSEGFVRHLATVRRLADEICGHCVPREFAPQLRGWMDRIQQLARSIG